MRAFGLIGTLGVCGAVAAAGGCATSAVFEQELTKTNTQTVLAFEETVFNKHEVSEAFAHYVGPSFLEHDLRIGGREAEARDSGPAAAAGAAGAADASGAGASGAGASDAGVNDKAAAVRAYGALLGRVAGGAHRVFLRTVAQGDLVAVQSYWDGLPGRVRRIAVVDIYRLSQGRIVEHWDVTQGQAP